MTTIERLMIRGVRSFSPRDSSVVEFGRPLTIIVGQNGAGKTTIIEALLYASTGEVPPGTDRGRAFVHDTKVAGEREVKAQVKLQFTTSGNRVVITRSMQLTQTRAGALKFKTLDAAVSSMDANGKKVTSSKKCADMDKLVPQLMRVSPAILQSVIFCHQSDSDWPLSDSSELKKRFDAIFAATRYTKALDEIRRLRKTQMQELKVYKLKIEHTLTKRNQAVKIMEALTANRESLDSRNAMLCTLDAEAAVLNDEIAVLEAKQREHAESIDRAKVVRAQIASKEAELKEAKDALPVQYTETLDELVATSQKWSESIAHLNAKLTRKRQEVDELQRNLDASQARVNEMQTSLQVMEADAKRGRELTAKRDTMLRSLVVKHCADAVDQGDGDAALPLSRDTVDEHMKALNNVVDRLAKTVSDASARAGAMAAAHEEQVTAVRSQRMRLSAEMAEKRRQMSTARQTVAEEEAKADAITKQVAQVTVSQVDVDEAAKQLEILRQAQAEDDLDSRIRTLVEAKEHSEDSLRAAGEAMKRASSLAGVVSQLRAAQQHYADKKTEFADVKRTAVPLCKAALQGSWSSVQQLQALMDASRARNAEAVASAEQQLKAQAQLLSAKEAEAHLTTERISTLTSEIKGLQSQVEKQCTDVPPDVPYEQVLESFRGKEREMRDAIANITAGQALFEGFIQQAKDSAPSASDCGACPLCERSFAANAGLQQLLASLQARLDRVPTQVDALQRQQAEAAKRVSALEDVAPLLHALQMKRTNVAAAQRQVDAVQEELVSLRSRHADAQAAVDAALVQREQLEGVQPHVQDMIRVYTDMSAAKQRLTQLQAEAGSEVEGALTVAQAQQAYTDVQAKCISLGKQVGELQVLKARAQEELHAAEQRVSKVKNDVLQAEADQRKAEAAQAALKGALEVIAACEASVTQLEAQIGDLDAQCRALKAEHEPLHAVALAEVSQALAGQRELQEELARVRMYESDVPSDDDVREREARKAELEQQQAKAEKAVARWGRKLGKARASVDEVSGVIVTSGDSKVSIDANIAYLKGVQALESMRVELVALDAALGAGGFTQTDRLKHLQGKRAKVQTKRDRVKGSTIELTTTKKRLEADLDECDFDNIESQHKEEWIGLTTLDLANKDLEAYHKALDSALMHFHTAKMEEINKIIRELWQATYQGNDIDTIAIRSDAEGAAKSGVSKRSYKYRVVMVKGAVELDLRGRCSAGQRVMASLVIRLALAETFCVHCGILALDEPTTNLDQHNIRSLARALVTLIESRRRQANFQLILITHDEEFVQLLGQHADSYWRVTKGFNQCTLVEKRPVSELA